VTRETKLGLLVGLSFIVLFAVIISEPGSQGRDAMPADFGTVRTANRGGPVSPARPGAESPAHEGRLPVDKGLNTREVKTQSPPVHRTPESRPEYIADASPRGGLPVVPTDTGAAPSRNAATITEPAQPALAMNKPASEGPGLVIPRPLNTERGSAPPITNPAVANAAHANNAAAHPPKTAPNVAPGGLAAAPAPKNGVAPDARKPNAAARASGLPQADPRSASGHLSDLEQRVNPVAGANDPSRKSAGRTETAAAADVTSTEEMPNGSPRRHTIGRGDTLRKLARAYYGSTSTEYVDLIFKANRRVLRDRHNLRVGQELVIPVSARSSSAVPAVADAALRKQRTLAARSESDAIDPTRATDAAANRDRTPVRIPKPADSGRSDIARTADARKSAAGRDAGARKASAAGKDSAQLVKNSDAPARSYVVRRGDVLGKIAARELGDSSRAAEIYQLNRAQMKNPNVLEPGLKLKLPPKSSGKGSSGRAAT